MVATTNFLFYPIAKFTEPCFKVVKCMQMSMDGLVYSFKDVVLATCLVSESVQCKTCAELWDISCDILPIKLHRWAAKVHLCVWFCHNAARHTPLAVRISAHYLPNCVDDMYNMTLSVARHQRTSVLSVYWSSHCFSLPASFWPNDMTVPLTYSVRYGPRSFRVVVSPKKSKLLIIIIIIISCQDYSVTIEKLQGHFTVSSGVQLSGNECKMYCRHNWTSHTQRLKARYTVTINYWLFLLIGLWAPQVWNTVQHATVSSQEQIHSTSIVQVGP